MFDVAVHNLYDFKHTKSFFNDKNNKSFLNMRFKVALSLTLHTPTKCNIKKFAFHEDEAH